MKKRWTYILGVLLIIFVISSLYLPQDVKAQSNSEGQLIDDDKFVKVGDYYYKQANDGIYISDNKTDSGEYVSLEQSSNMDYHRDAYFSGEYIYYSCYDKSSKKDVLYRMKPDGSEQERLVKLSQKSIGGIGISLVYENNIYFNWGDFAYDGIMKSSKFNYMCRYNMKSEKQKYYKPFITGFVAIPYKGNSLGQYDNYKQYFLTHTSGGDYCEIPTYVLNAHTGKMVLISKYAGHTRLRGKTVYYVRGDKRHKHFWFYSCNLQGKNQKKLCEFKGDNELPAITVFNDKYCKIVAYNHNKKKSKYQYYFNTKKLKRLK